ncbi:T7SS effector LXG polymorphic toxin [Bacillus glycinifermentans]|uniref:T7SS effector LXG polymorphic toxin n=1 Tax=Bacillus glycinifermentans TaxID=1664069 RepID=A0A0T6BJ18_9BACI|nr:T7SS effector LXG polymorphic toxin [Bacillus glycinifermentans]ATH95195.1 transposase [Bacillus glycinifermentans]KRT89385.1 transposase [Bacillus glycinifermentans]MEC0483264.1 T7SS effector LXG polymorphic toxin [Bacillus glycinifermentans]MEC0493115.1 T7SS effector LXG polymorphic toxin [Bacillus glycinifermentans]MEC0541415.1 T7SS effector LXG polymorphic toxin [Bacillus glycinifermentans]
MKTLDVQALHQAIDKTLEQLKKQSEEIANLKKSVDGITSLDDALKGKGGDAIRAFYEECHTPFLQFYETFINEYESALKNIKNALNSLEPNHNGYISQAFLEHDLENGLNAADRTTKNLVSKANAAIAKVSHIVDLPDLNDNEFHEQNRKALTDINQTIEKLHTFDREQTSTLKTAESDLETMQKYIARLEKMYTGPKIEITTYQKGSILKPDKIDSLQPNEDTPMEVMLKKVGEKEEAEINKLADTDRTATQKVSKKVYSDEELENLSEKELAKLKKVYKYVNGFKYCFYMDGKNVVGIKLVDDPPEDDEEVSDLEKYAGIGLELLGESDLERAALGYDPDTHERLSLFERVDAGVNLTPPARLIKWIRRGTKLAKVSKIGKGSKTPSYGKQSVPKGPYREVNGFPAKVKPGAQEKHIPGTPNYKQEVANGKNKSIFNGDNKTAQELLDKFAGKGKKLGKNKERVDFGQVIGKYYDMDTGKYVETTNGMIHYGKDGAHIVPARP